MYINNVSPARVKIHKILHSQKRYDSYCDLFTTYKPWLIE